jgi:DNA repair protein RadD
VADFRAAAIPAAFVHGKTPADVRARALADFAGGHVRVLVNIFLLTEGWDCPPCDTCILARQMGSVAMYIQSVGRVLRPHPGKREALLIDLAGNVDAHGAIDSPYEYHLQGQGIRRKGEIAEVCRACGGPKIAGLACERCGRGGPEEMETPGVEGVELVSWQERKRMEPPKKRVQALARWMREAEAKGWKRGAINFKYRGTYGHFPPRWATEQAKVWNEQQARATAEAMARFEEEAAQ